MRDDDPRDYSSTSDESDDDAQSEQPRFFLQSDVSQKDSERAEFTGSGNSGIGASSNELFTLNKLTYKGSHADESIYT